MKIIKKSFNIFLAIVLLAVTFVTPVYRVEAKTIADMKKELQAKEDEYANKKAQKELTEAQKKKVENSIATNEQKITDLKNDTIRLNDEISKLNASISQKYNDIKKVLNYVQVSNGESSYLEYIFGAKTFTDFIYRASVAEQLTKYNKDLVNQYNSDIKKSKEKQDEISKKQTEIAAIQVELNSSKVQLGQAISNLNDDMLSDEEETKLIRKNIQELQNTYKCSDNEDIDSCKAKAIKSNYIPPSSGSFLRPIVDAIVTANYGYYDPYHTGRTTWHAAMDLAGNPGAKIYAAAVGKVVSVEHSACGNHIVYIAHNVNGRRYTTGYWHMRTAYVTVGEIVTSSTVIGIQGGLSSEDRCSTGQHLDFVFTTGAYKTDYFNSPRAVSTNPRNYLSFPPLIQGPWQGIGTSTEWHTR